MTICTADDAIARSIHHNEIVHLDYCSSLNMDLRDVCEDSRAHDDVTEIWGTTEDGDQWRVHLHSGPTGDYRDE